MTENELRGLRDDVEAQTKELEHLVQQNHGDPLVEGVGVSDAAERLLVLAVASERAEGRSWNQIADKLGITCQAAEERYETTVEVLLGEDALT